LTAYLHIIERIGPEPVIWRFESNYDSKIAQVCVRQALRRRKIGDVFMLRQDRILVIWQGDAGVMDWPLRPKLISTGNGKTFP
jgi:hypothetical protein